MLDACSHAPFVIQATEFLLFGKVGRFLPVSDSVFFMLQSTTNEVKMAVVVMCMGVTMATVNDVGVAPFGLLIGIFAIFGAVQQQILIGKMQKDLNATANQLLVAYTP